MRCFYLILFFCFCSCKSISIANETQIKASRPIELGTIGEVKLFIFEEDYNSTAIPILNEPIKVNIGVIDFNRSTFKTFDAINTKKGMPLKINYIDSLDKKPKFLKLELADRVSILNALNDKANSAIKDYLRNKKGAHIVSAISIAFNKEKITSIMDTEALFLEQLVNKTFVLNAYKDNQIVTSLKFNEGLIFAYQASNFCWQENDKYQLEIVDIVERKDKCPNKAYRNSARAKKKIDYFKF